MFQTLTYEQEGIAKAEKMFSFPIAGSDSRTSKMGTRRDAHPYLEQVLKITVTHGTQRNLVGRESSRARVDVEGKQSVWRLVISDYFESLHRLWDTCCVFAVSKKSRAEIFF